MLLWLAVGASVFLVPVLLAVWMRHDDRQQAQVADGYRTGLDSLRTERLRSLVRAIQVIADPKPTRPSGRAVVEGGTGLRDDRTVAFEATGPVHRAKHRRIEVES